MESVIKTSKKVLVLGLIAAAAAVLAVWLAQAVPAQAQNQDEIGTISIDTAPDQAPVISFVHEGTVLAAIADDNNLDSASWRRTGPLSDGSDCQAENLTYTHIGLAASTVALTEADNGYLYCFEVTDHDNHVARAGYRVSGVVEVVEEEVEEEEVVEEEPPAPQPLTKTTIDVQVIQDGSRVWATTTADIEEPEYAAVAVLSANSCNGSAFQRALEGGFILYVDSVDGLTSNANGRFYCFRVSNATHLGYGYVRISGLQPEIPPVVPPAETTPAPMEGGQDGTDANGEQTGQSTEGDDGSSDDGDENDELLRYVAIGVVVLGIVLILGILFSKRQPGAASKDDDDEL